MSLESRILCSYLFCLPGSEGDISGIILKSVKSSGGYHLEKHFGCPAPYFSANYRNLPHVIMFLFILIFIVWECYHAVPIAAIFGGLVRYLIEVCQWPNKSGITPNPTEFAATRNSWNGSCLRQPQVSHWIIRVRKLKYDWKVIGNLFIMPCESLIQELNLIKPNSVGSRVFFMACLRVEISSGVYVFLLHAIL